MSDRPKRATKQPSRFGEDENKKKAVKKVGVQKKKAIKKKAPAGVKVATLPAPVSLSSDPLRAGEPRGLVRAADEASFATMERAQRRG
jgi:hypothetical protein